MDAPIAKPPPGMRQIDDSDLQRFVLRRLGNQPPQRRSGEPHKPTGATLGDRKPLPHLRHRLSFGLWG
jgi:hypothetical protein